VAAVNRAQSALVNYPRTPSNEDALIVLIRSYDALGMTQLRDDSQRVLKDTFPNGKFFAAAAGKPWWNFWSKQETVLPPAKPVVAEKAWWQFW
jgi:outer membrane protein assembly factor BamD